MASLIKVTLVRGLSKCTETQKRTLQGLGLRKRHQTKILQDTVPIRGMVMKVQHMIEVERFEGDDALRDSARLRAQRQGSTHGTEAANVSKATASAKGRSEAAENEGSAS
ncbi:MAG: 50S ribosomal protein L30 [Myxococcota bacterium]